MYDIMPDLRGKNKGEKQKLSGRRPLVLWLSPVCSAPGEPGLHEVGKALRGGGLRHVPQRTQIDAARRDLEGGAQLAQPSALELARDELLRHARHAEADGGEVDEQAPRAELDLRMELQPFCRKYFSRYRRLEALRSSRISGKREISSSV